MTLNQDQPLALEPLPCAVIKLGRRLERQLQHGLNGLGLSASQLVAMIDIARHPGISRADLSRELRITPQAIAGITGNLLGMKLIARTKHVPGRPTAFSVTRLGAQMLRQATPALKAVHGDLLASLQPTTASTVDVTVRQLLAGPGCGTDPRGTSTAAAGCDV